MVECCFRVCKWVRHPGRGDTPCLTCALNARAARASRSVPLEQLQGLLDKYCQAAESLAERAKTPALEDIPKVVPEESIPSEVPGGASSPSGGRTEVDISDSSS